MFRTSERTQFDGAWAGWLLCGRLGGPIPATEYAQRTVGLEIPAVHVSYTCLDAAVSRLTVQEITASVSV